MLKVAKARQTHSIPYTIHDKKCRTPTNQIRVITEPIVKPFVGQKVFHTLRVIHMPKLSSKCCQRYSRFIHLDLMKTRFTLKFTKIVRILDMTKKIVTIWDYDKNHHLLSYHSMFIVNDHTRFSRRIFAWFSTIKAGHLWGE